MAEAPKLLYRKATTPVLGNRQAEPTQNAILRNLPRQERETALAKMDFVSLPARALLNEMSERIEFGYFPNAGLASILNVLSDGKSVEVGVVGKEGFVGLPLIVGFETSPIHAVMQIHGSAFRVKGRDVAPLLRACPKLKNALERYAQEFALQVTHVAACNRLHEVRQRLARWLLMSADRMGSLSFPLTQEFLSHMLGTRRASVTVAAGALQRAKLITYRRGTVEILDRRGLEKAACECYRQLNEQLDRWHTVSR